LEADEKKILAIGFHLGYNEKKRFSAAPDETLVPELWKTLSLFLHRRNLL